MSSQKKYALITGGTSGFGYEFAKLFAKDGYNLILVARLEDRLEQVSEEIRSLGVEVHTITADLFRQESVMEIYNEVKSKNLLVDVLVNNAGQGFYGRFAESDLQPQLDIVQLNINSLVSLTHCFLKDMLARNEGKILQIGSVFSKTPAPLMAVYAATKAFVLSFTHGIIDEIKDTGLTMTVLMPGAADTDFFHKAGAVDTKVYGESELQDPAVVAKDGYEALMSGTSSVTSGLKNKIQGVMADFMPDTLNAAMAHKQSEEIDKPASEVRTQSTHQPSINERSSLERKGAN